MNQFSDFTSWQSLATFSGSVAVVGIFVQFTKTVLDEFIKIPTRLYTYIVSLIILTLSDFFLGQFTLSSFVLDLFNAVLVSFSADGVYHLFSEINTEK